MTGVFHQNRWTDCWTLKGRSMETSPSLYEAHAVAPHGQESNPRPSPGTQLTASIETIDNDRAALLLEAGIVR